MYDIPLGAIIPTMQTVSAHKQMIKGERSSANI